MKLSQLILIGLTGAAAQLTLAHTELSESIPADRAMLETAPEDLTLRFSEPVRLTALTVQKDAMAKRNLGPLPSDASQQFAVAVPALENGHYTVTWRALSEDTHVISGEFMFMVGPLGDHAEQMNHAADSDDAQSEHAGH